MPLAVEQAGVKASYKSQVLLELTRERGRRALIQTVEKSTVLPGLLQVFVQPHTFAPATVPSVK